MSTENPVPTAAPAETVIEFGGASADPGDTRRASRGRRSLTELGHGLAADRRSVPLAATVGALALLASLVSEWQVTSLTAAPFGDETPSVDRPLVAGAADLGALGSGYIIGLFVLAAAMVLVLFGPAAGRRHVRLIGLTTAGVLLGLLVALGSALGESSRVLDSIVRLQLDEDQIQLAYGRGLWCAFLGVLAVLLALWLAGRHLPPDGPVRFVEEAEPEGAAPEAGPVVWSWRRPGRDESPDAEDRPDAPMDLTVSSTNPFTLRSEDRDKAARDDDAP